VNSRSTRRLPARPSLARTASSLSRVTSARPAAAASPGGTRYPVSPSTTISAAIADCCIVGDLWRATIWKGNSTKTFRTVANAPAFVAGAPPFAPDVYSPEGLVAGRVSGVYVLVTLGNTAPAGFPAGGTLRITTNGGNATCVRKQLVGGFADP